MSGELDKGGRHRGPASPSFGGRRTPISTVEEAVQALAPLDTTLEEMRDKLWSSDPSFRHRMKTFMDELLLVGVGMGVGRSICPFAARFWIGALLFSSLCRCLACRPLSYPGYLPSPGFSLCRRRRRRCRPCFLVVLLSKSVVVITPHTPPVDRQYTDPRPACLSTSRTILSSKTVRTTSPRLYVGGGVCRVDDDDGDGDGGFDG